MTVRVSLTRYEAAKIVESLKWSEHNVANSKYTDPGKPARVAEWADVRAAFRRKLRRD